ncbi:16S rRNA (cytidine(1402)-2'-O)-methyltransferase [Candidatus Phycosocius spiralis]|uniref:Ribosomal RNA small subunit methyltransferase I n=1 Tax=Candidatus Phycosocius spiralis TaxID=2815099 RepID=A0ABQ4PTV6_9PROT|nr:16S rRNA (cytidine(1402)-2'-O)-methyltransferase [Candidatus Phycosocius spiralis]GIU66417.1 ribosomal RNA small subunit methyltransferase I [Candidatus Phycosocius spiralis]
MANNAPNHAANFRHEVVTAQSQRQEIAFKKILEPALYLVATPIGNLGDFSPRGAQTLNNCDLVLAEDTRVTKRLMRLHGIKGRVIRCDEAATELGLQAALQVLYAGGAVTFCCDAGTPGVSDPGERLARGVIDAGFQVRAIPGASAALAALTVSGLPSKQFFFAGFAPAKASARAAFFHECATIPASLIFYETGPRLQESLAAMLKIFGNRMACVARELTKLYEETRRGSLEELVNTYAKASSPRGEIVVVVAGASHDQAITHAAEVNDLLKEALTRLSVKDAAAAIAFQTGLSRKDVYGRALALIATTRSAKP